MLHHRILSIERMISSVYGRSDTFTYGMGGTIGGGMLSGAHAGRSGVFAGAMVFGIGCSTSRFAFEALFQN
jgi:hypothetical protein